MGTWLLACSSGTAENGGNGGNGSTAVNADAVGANCNDVGPSCGLTVMFESVLPYGTYSFSVTTSAGETTCNLEVAAPRFQTADEAAAQDAMLAACAENGDCPAPRCTGPDTVYVSSDSVTVAEERAQVKISIRETEGGVVAEQTFIPAYEDHPSRTAECHRCRVATDSMPLPE